MQMPLAEIPLAYPDTVNLADHMIDQQAYSIREALRDGGIDILDNAATREEEDG